LERIDIAEIALTPSVDTTILAASSVRRMHSRRRKFRAFTGSARCRERAPEYDRNKQFCKDDFEELRAAGYLLLAVPEEFGGLGMNLVQVGRETRRLAQHAPATALALNMHNYWVGDAAGAWRSGDHSLEWLLRETDAGEVFAAGHAEHGNDIPGLLSTTRAERR
jgi:alkylation response protein AidB-like acyl-CoA dehydrogenase